MKTNLLRTLCLLSILLTSTSLKHPIKLTSSLIEYDSVNKSLHVETRVFIDDFIASLKKSKGISINIDKLTKNDELKITEYFNQYFHISVNQKRLIFNYGAVQLMKDYNMAAFKFDFKGVPLKRGTSLEISNRLFFAEFGYNQLNTCLLRLSPLSEEENYEFSLNESAITKTL